MLDYPEKEQRRHPAFTSESLDTGAVHTLAGRGARGVRPATWSP